TYIDPETVERFRQDTEANFTGIGIQIRKDTNRDMLQVISPIKDSPAYKVGIKAGDVITQIKREMDSKGKPLDPPEVISTKGLRVEWAEKKTPGKANPKGKTDGGAKGGPKAAGVQNPPRLGRGRDVSRRPPQGRRQLGLLVRSPEQDRLHSHHNLC